MGYIGGLRIDIFIGGVGDEYVDQNGGIRSQCGMGNRLKDCGKERTEENKDRK